MLLATPLFISSYKGHIGVVKLLLDGKAKINQAATDSGATPLFISAQNGHLAVVKALLETGAADLNQGMVIASCHSPLTIAAFFGHDQVCCELLEAKADLKYKAKPKREEPLKTKGGTAADLAAEQDCMEALTVLQGQSRRSSQVGIITECPGCHTSMEWSDYSEGTYAGGWSCNNVRICGSSSSSMGRFRWFCRKCRNDFCAKCSHGALSESGGNVSPALHKPSHPRHADTSATLLAPVSSQTRWGGPDGGRYAPS
jgi:hypothetical protein